jgi:chemotaxis response regulator CheB
VRVVIVDDEEDLRFLAAESLRSDGRFVVVGEGANGAEAIDVVAEVQPDVVLLDLEMPWLTGAEAVPYLCSDAPGAVIILWTVAPDGPRAMDALALGASSVIDKAACGMRGLGDAIVRELLAASMAQPAAAAARSFATSS